MYLGWCLGDAFGGPYEGAVQPIEITDSRPWRLSDDTQLTIATCEGIIASGGIVKPEAIVVRFAEWFRMERVTGGSSGYVVESVPLALLGTQRIRSVGFRRMVEELIRCGGDTDTIAFIAGQIAETLESRSGLPRALLDHLPERGLLERVASQFAEIVVG